MTEALALSPAQAGSRLRRIAILGFAAALVIVSVLHETALELAGIWWRSGTFAHGLVVVPIAAWLIWLRRAQLAPLPLSPSALALIPLALAGTAWLVGAAASVAVVEHFALVAMLVSALWAVWGDKIARALVFPLAFLFFGVPFGEFLIPTMMQYTADFTVAALRLSGIPVYREGLQFVIPSGHWSVVEACSGIRYLIASTMVGTLFAWLNYRSWRRRSLFIVAAVLVPLLANWLRAYLIVMLGHLSGNRIATGVDHLIYGWFFFGLVILALFWAGARWREDAQSEEADAGAVAASAGAGPSWAMLVAVLALAAPWPPLLGWLVDVPQAPAHPLVPVPAAPGWRLDAAGPVAGFLPHYVGERARSLASYRYGSRVVSILIVHYAHQLPGHELVQWDNRLLFSEDKYWAETESRADSPLPGIDAKLSALRGARGERLIAWRWNWLDGLRTADDVAAKLALAADRLARRPDDSAAIVVWTEAGEAPGPAREAVQVFLAAHLAAIERSVRAVAQAR